MRKVADDFRIDKSEINWSVIGEGMTLGSLFDGSGGFPLSGVLYGVQPLWASEIEPFPIKVTSRNFPGMIHLGDITKIKGGEVQPVDILTFGSPCQDLSIAGKRGGLEGSRSGLFYHAIRIIKEMLEATDGKYPTFIVWENVFGAYSSNETEDFRAVLQEIAAVAGNTAAIPGSPKGGWLRAGVILGDGFSIAWRTFDAKYWGVPQNRRRIYLVADIGGCRAAKILFNETCVPRYFTKGIPAWETAAGAADGSADGSMWPDIARAITTRGRNVGYDKGANIVVQDQEKESIWPEVSRTLIRRMDSSPAIDRGAQFVVQAAGFMSGQGAKARSIGWNEEQSPTLRAAESGSNRTPSVVIKPTYAADCRNGQVRYEHSGTLQAHEHGEFSYNRINPVLCLQGNGIDRADTAGCNGKGVKENISYTLNTIDLHAVCYQSGNTECLTPGESISKRVYGLNGPFPTLASMESSGQSQQAVCYPVELHSQDSRCNIKEDGIVQTLSRRMGTGGCNVPLVMSTGQKNAEIVEDRAPALNCNHEQPILCMRERGGCEGGGKGALIQKELTSAIRTQADQVILLPSKKKYIIRRLIPKECGRLQGYPDWWCEGIPHSDSAEYKMWGNGVALPCASYVIGSIALFAYLTRMEVEEG